MSSEKGGYEQMTYVPMVSVIGGATLATYGDADRARTHADEVNRRAGFHAVDLAEPVPHNPTDDDVDDLVARARGKW